MALSILAFLGLVFPAIAINGQSINNTTTVQPTTVSFCGGCDAGGLDGNDGIFYTVPLTDTTYSLNCITEYISTNKAGVFTTTTTTNKAVLSSFDDFIASKFVPWEGSRAITVPVSIFPTYGVASVRVNPLEYGTISTVAGSTTCVYVYATPLGPVPLLRLYPDDPSAQAAATTSLLETAYFSPLPPNCSIVYAGEPYYQIPVQWLTSTVNAVRSAPVNTPASTSTTSSDYHQSPTVLPAAPLPATSTKLQGSRPTSNAPPIATPGQAIGSSVESNMDNTPSQTSVSLVSANGHQDPQPTGNLPSVSAAVSGPVTSVAIPARITFGSSTIQINSESAYIISSHTLTPGGVLTIDSTTISLAADGSQVVINSKTETISQPASTTGVGGIIISAFNGPRPTSTITTTTGSSGGQVATGDSNCRISPHHHLALLMLSVIAGIICI